MTFQNYSDEYGPTFKTMDSELIVSEGDSFDTIRVRSYKFAGPVLKLTVTFVKSL